MSDKREKTTTGQGAALGENQSKAIRFIANAIVESVREAGDMGAPSGIVYAALNAWGINLDQYYAFISALKRLGKLRQEGDLLFVI